MVQPVTQLFLSRLVFKRPPHDSHGVHQALWRGFPGGSRDFLFRADRTTEGGVRLRVLVQSVRDPDWSLLRPDLESVEKKPLTWEFQAGDRFRFLLRANPTVRRKGSHESATRALSGEAYRAVDGHRVPIRGDEARAEWLHRKASAGGFRVEACRQQNSTTTLWGRGGTRATHEGVDFEGILVVTDRENFRKALTAGIGSAKAFGYGLLSLARADRT